MEGLYFIFYQQLKHIKMTFKRYLMDEISWQNRLICILGARGVGKSTLLLQHIKEQFGTAPRTVLYVSLDHIWFSANTLYELGERFVLQGGVYLFLDEVHKYKNWAQEIKNLYDAFPTLHIVFTGSAILEIEKGNADLSRRVTAYTMNGMSFREYLALDHKMIFAPVSLEQLVNCHVELSLDITSNLKILPLFSEYLKYGYYPYYQNDKNDFHNKLQRTIGVVLEEDLTSIEKIDYYSIDKIKKLLYVIASLVPFTPNISDLSSKIGVSRNSLLAYLHFLSKAKIINTLYADATAFRQLTKPEKIYLGDPNLCYALAFQQQPNMGNLRETFFYSQLFQHTIRYTSHTDFKIDNHFFFEIGGKNKGTDQILELENAYLAIDDIENGYSNHIPLWLFGFLY